MLGQLLVSELAIARVELAGGRRVITRATLRALLVELDLLARLGILPVADAAPLRGLVSGVISSI